MYSMVAGHKQGTEKQGSGPPREQTEGKTEKKEKKEKKRSLRDIVMQYFRKRLDPPMNDDFEEPLTPWGPGGRYRPEPPATLAKASRFTQHEIKLMYRGFKQECPTGVVDEEAFKNIFSQFFPLGDATQYAHFVFNTIKPKQRGTLNFEEYLETLSRVARGSRQEKLSWVFALYDADGDGRISRGEMLAVVRAVYELLGRAAAPPAQPATAEDHVDRIFHLMDTNADGVVTPDELARWCARDPALLHSLDTLDTVL